MESAFNTPFSEHVRTNYVPSSREKAHISQLLVVPKQEVRMLDAEIAQLQKKFDEVKARRDSLNTIVTEHRHLLTPFRRVSDNVLKNIFIYCLLPERNANMSPSEAPLLLGRVCKRWRDVAYDTPYLWATLHIERIPSPTNSLLEAEFSTQEHLVTFRVRCHLQAILQWLNRSGTYPLSLSIHSSVDTTSFHAYLYLLLSFSHRWLDIEVWLCHESASVDLATLVSISPDAFPVLEVLHLTFPWETDEYPRPEWKTQCDILRGKNLRSITIHYFPFDLEIMEIDWSRLTSLILCNSSSAKRKSTPGEAHRILGHCVNLKHLTIAIYDPSPTGVQFASPYFYLPDLESLSVNDHYYYLASLFDGIDAPSLNRVSYSTHFWPSNLRRSPLGALLARNGQSVETLTTDPRYFFLSDVVGCFKMTPLLSKFVCNASHLDASGEQRAGTYETPITSYVMKAIFQMMEPTSDGQCYWPRLQVIESTLYNQLDDQVVLTFIQKRMAAAGVLKSTGKVLPLKEVKITFRRPKQIDIASILEEYTRDGLRLDLREYCDHNVYRGYTSPTPGKFDPYAGMDVRDDKIVVPF